MGRFRATAQGNVPFTPEEEAQRDAEELAWSNGEKDRQRASIIAQITDIETTDRAVREMLLKSGNPADFSYQKLKANDDAIKLLRAQLNAIV